jgi:hypothetical protein
LSVPTPTHSVSTFQQLCLLSKLMTRIVNRFYVIGATAENTKSHLQSVDDALSTWYRNLPEHLQFEPWVENPNQPTTVPPNNIILLTTWNALVILLHRPFIFDGHLRPAIIPATSWKRCTTSARNISSLATAYQKMHALRRAPYLLSYAVYVACTIHVSIPVRKADRGLSADPYRLGTRLQQTTILTMITHPRLLCP